MKCRSKVPEGKCEKNGSHKAVQSVSQIHLSQNLHQFLRHRVIFMTKPRFFAIRHHTFHCIGKEGVLSNLHSVFCPRDVN
jgi:hypothetical protein